MTIQELVRKQEQDYISGSTTISKYVDFNQYDNINKIDAYSNSRFTTGDTDSLGRLKPFFNIVTAAVNIWYRATDIDRKNIKIKANSASKYILSILANIHLENWMKKSRFGQFLNEWGRGLAKYGSVVVKFVEKGGELFCEVIPWQRLISDIVDFNSNPVIEVLFLTPAQLRENKSYDQKVVEGLISSASARENLDSTKKDNKNEFIKLYEVHGNLPLSLITEKEKDEKIFVQQMHVISFIATKNKGEYDEFCLIKGRENKSPYMITHLIKEDGRSQSIGAVEYLFDAQWMVNHSMKAIKDQLDLASKIIFQTSDGNYVGRNVLTSLETGSILIHKTNEPLTQINNGSHDITSLQNFSTQWQGMAKELTSTPDAIRGNTMPSGTAYRSVAISNQESNSLFELMTENKGLAIEDMMREYILPFIQKKLDTSEEISATLDSQGITQIDSIYIPNEAKRIVNQQIKEKILSGGMVSQQEQGQMIESQASQLKQELANLGSQRFIKPSEVSDKTWKDIFKDFVWTVEVEVTNESSDKQTILTTLTTVLQSIAQNPNILQDPNMRLLFNRILETTGNISPIELGQVQQQSGVQSANNGGSVIEQLATQQK